MSDFLPADPRTRRTVLIVWAVGVVIGTIAVFWLSSYLESLTELARTDREASLHLFRTRVVPALVLVAVGSAASGVVLARYGIRVIRSGRFPPPETRLELPNPRRGTGAVAAGWLIVFAGLMLAIAPAAAVALVLWLLQGAG